MAPFWQLYLLAVITGLISVFCLLSEQTCLGTPRTTTTVCDTGNASAQLQVYTGISVLLASIHLFGVFSASEESLENGRLHSYLAPLTWICIFVAAVIVNTFGSAKGASWTACSFLAIADILYSFYVMRIYNWSAEPITRDTEPIMAREAIPLARVYSSVDTVPARKNRDIPSMRVYTCYIATSGIFLVLLDTITGLAFVNAGRDSGDLNVTTTIILLCLKIAFVDLGTGVWIIAGLQWLCFRKHKTYLCNGVYYLSVERGICRAIVSAFLFRRYLLADGNRAATDSISVLLLVDMSINLFVAGVAFVTRFKILGMDSFDWNTMKQLRLCMFYGLKEHIE
jgi:hypothetical protein